MYTNQQYAAFDHYVSRVVHDDAARIPHPDNTCAFVSVIARPGAARKSKVYIQTSMDIPEIECNFCDQNPFMQFM